MSDFEFCTQCGKRIEPFVKTLKNYDKALCAKCNSKWHGGKKYRDYEKIFPQRKELQEKNISTLSYIERMEYFVTKYGKKVSDALSSTASDSSIILTPKDNTPMVTIHCPKCHRTHILTEKKLNELYFFACECKYVLIKDNKILVSK